MSAFRIILLLLPWPPPPEAALRRAFAGDAGDAAHGARQPPVMEFRGPGQVGAGRACPESILAVVIRRSIVAGSDRLIRGG